MKRLYSLLLVVILALSLQGCIFREYIDHKRQSANTPCKQVGTTWRSEDGKIQFTIVEGADTINADGITIMGSTHGVGTITTDDGCIDIIFETFLQCKVYIRDNVGETDYEIGVGDFEHNDQLTVTFNEKTTYLEEGAVITFYRVDE